MKVVKKTYIDIEKYKTYDSLPIPKTNYVEQNLTKKKILGLSVT